MDETGDTDDQIERWVNRAGLVLLALVLLGGAWLIIRGPEEPKSPAELAAEYEPSAADAERMCREDVAGKLKAPSAATFGDVRSTISDDLDPDRWTVTGWVDAENNFGATIRSEWTCDATHRGGGRWRTLVEIR